MTEARSRHSVPMWASTMLASKRSERWATATITPQQLRFSLNTHKSLLKGLHFSFHFARYLFMKDYTKPTGHLLHWVPLKWAQGLLAENRPMISNKKIYARWPVDRSRVTSVPKALATEEFRVGPKCRKGFYQAFSCHLIGLSSLKHSNKNMT